MNNTPIIITGCQRSGTTLLHLILDSHPEIRGVDEMEFRNEHLLNYLTHADYHPFVSLKLPTFSHDINGLKKIPKTKVLWCIRDYRDVISSMIKLQLNFNGTASSWAIHPYGGGREIKSCEKVLENRMDDELIDLLRSYHQMITTPPDSAWSNEKVVFVAALCWRLKQEVLKLYDIYQIEYSMVFYEKLLQNPKEEIEKILSYLNIQWNENVLNHHKIHSGFSVGNTDNAKPIDKSNIGKWKETLQPEDIKIIDEVCLNTAIKFGYQ